jgi:hypothetical protein
VRRRLFNIASVASLLLCAATVVLWMRSSLIVDAAQVGVGRDHTVSAWSDSGQVGFCVTTFTNIWCDGQFHLVAARQFMAPRLFGARYDLPEVEIPPQFVTVENFVWKSKKVSSPTVVGQIDYSYVAFPHWLVASLLCLWPEFQQISRWRPARPTGFCAVCGYNLTGNASGACPECGTPVISTSV